MLSVLLGGTTQATGIDWSWVYLVRSGLSRPNVIFDYTNTRKYKQGLKSKLVRTRNSMDYADIK